MAGVGAAAPLRDRGRRVRDNVRALERAHRLLAFGAGPHDCPARDVALAAAAAALDAVVGRHRLELADPAAAVAPASHGVGAPIPGRLVLRIG